VRNVNDLTREEMRKALRDLQTFCYAEGGDEPDAMWSPCRPEDIGNQCRTL
jgi:hypothetical protein